jgi:sulfur dioxygenase
MLFRQFFESETCSFTYIIAKAKGCEAIIIDPVYKKTDHYLTLIEELDLTLVKAIDTHVHADHLSGLGILRDKTNCITVMGAQSNVDVVSMRVEGGDKIIIDGLSLDVIYTPGHTNDSYSFYMPGIVFTGDTLLIRGTGRTDFQAGNSLKAYDSLFNKLLKLPDETIIYPGHDYKGDCCSTIGEEKTFNPRLQVNSPESYAKIMNDLGLPDPKMMGRVIPKNQKIGMAQKDLELIKHTTQAHEALAQFKNQKTLFIDLRENIERDKNGIIPNSVHIPYQKLSYFTTPGGPISAISTKTHQQQLMLYCAFGERSAMALKELRVAGFKNVRHLGGGIEAWINASGPIDPAPKHN